MYNLCYVIVRFKFFSTNVISQTGRAVRHGSGVVKLLLRCLQSIQCQYYLVFGVVKTVPLCNLSQDCDASRTFHFSPPLYSPPLSPKKCFRNILFATSNGSTTTWRTVIDTYIIYCIYSVYVVPLLLTLCTRARVSP